LVASPEVIHFILVPLQVVVPTLPLVHLGQRMALVPGYYNPLALHSLLMNYTQSMC
jgi:hypothetical protein